MKTLNFILGLFIAVLFVACGSDDNGGGGAAAVDPKTELSTMALGSGGTCPNISGTYNCVETREGQNNNSTSTVQYNLYTNNQNQQILSQDGLALIADGKIHSFSGSVGQYVIDCNGTKLSLHMQMNDDNATKTTITKDSDTQISGITKVLNNGVISTSTGACTRQTGNNVPLPPNIPQDGTGFDFFGWFWDIFDYFNFQ